MKYIIKRVIDLLLSIVALVILSPILIIIPIAIRLDSNGPALFKQKRLTKYGGVFTMYKFRTMIEDAENMGTGLFNYANDFRVTKIGKILRKTSLDELPQLFNVVLGDMSIVGPRPPVFYELGDYEDLNDDYKRRFTVLPGITGLAQVKGRNELSWDQKVKYDNDYIDLFNKYGVLVDLKIMLLTVINVFKMKDIYEIREASLKDKVQDEIDIKVSKDILDKAHQGK